MKKLILTFTGLATLGAGFLQAADAPAPTDDKGKLSYALGMFFANRNKSQAPTGKVDEAAMAQGFNDVLAGKQSPDYVLGASMAQQLMRDKIEVDPAMVLSAFKDVLGGGATKLDQAAMQGELQKLQQSITARQQADAAKEAEKNEAEGKAFLEKNKSADGVKTTDSGMQYKVVEAAKDPNAAHPTAADTVECAYRGTLLDGTEFDKSPDGQPRQFPLNGVIKGWTEGIPLMSVGSKYRFWIPASLGYGNTPRGGTIKPGSLLVFDVELMKIMPKAAAAPTTPTPPITANQEKAVATTPPIAIEMKDGKPVVTQVKLDKDGKPIPPADMKKDDKKPAEAPKKTGK